MNPVFLMIIEKLEAGDVDVELGKEISSVFKTFIDNQLMFIDIIKENLKMDEKTEKYINSFKLELHGKLDEMISETVN